MSPPPPLPKKKGGKREIRRAPLIKQWSCHHQRPSEVVRWSLGRIHPYLVRLRCSIKVALECQDGVVSGDYRGRGPGSRGNGLALRRRPSDIQACIFWIRLEWLEQRQPKDRSNNYFHSSTCSFLRPVKGKKAAGRSFCLFIFFIFFFSFYDFSSLSLPLSLFAFFSIIFLAFRSFSCLFYSI